MSLIKNYLLPLTAKNIAPTIVIRWSEVTKLTEITQYLDIIIVIIYNSVYFSFILHFWKVTSTEQNKIVSANIIVNIMNIMNGKTLYVHLIAHAYIFKNLILYVNKTFLSILKTVIDVKHIYTLHFYPK